MNSSWLHQPFSKTNKSFANLTRVHVLPLSTLGLYLPMTWRRAVLVFHRLVSIPLLPRDTRRLSYNIALTSRETDWPVPYSQFQVLTTPANLHQCYTHCTQTWAYMDHHALNCSVTSHDSGGLREGVLDAAPCNADWIGIGKVKIPMYRFSEWMPMSDVYIGYSLVPIIAIFTASNN